MIRLDPMTGEEFAAYEQAGIASYAELHVRNGIWPAETALERAAKEYAKFLPQGLATPGHHLRVVRDGDRRVGTVWFGGRPTETARAAFIYNIEIAPSERGNGYGEAVMRAVEEVAIALGFDAVQLHVFGDNTVARSLYRKLGYAEINVSMTKRLAGPEDGPDRLG